MTTPYTVNSLNFDGTLRRSWKCDLVQSSSDLIVLRGEFETEIDHADLGVIRRGTVSEEFYWFDRWYNIFRFQEPEGTLKFFYCNIGMPPTLHGHTLKYIDLDIDILVNPDNSFVVLDEAEFAANAERFSYPSSVIGSAREAVKSVEALVIAGQIAEIAG